MITAVDTNVLIDVFSADDSFGERSLDALQRCIAEGRLVACDVVWAELGAVFPSAAAASTALGTLGVDFSAVDQDAAARAGDAWRAYRSAGGGRSRLVADFLVGAHAAHQADRLLTRDRGFYRTYFRGLEIVDPAA